MLVPYECPSCQHALRVLEHYRGKSVRCPSCNNTFIVPSATTDLVTERVNSNARPPEEAIAKRFEEVLPLPEAPLPTESAEPLLKFKVRIRHDPHHRLTGSWQAEVTSAGLHLRQGARELAVATGLPAQYRGGSRLEMSIEGRLIEVAVRKRGTYRQRLARDLTAYLNGDAAALQPAAYGVPWFLFAAAALPLGIPLLLLNGALWTGLGCVLGLGLAATGWLLVQRERFPLALRMTLTLTLALLGYGLVFAAPLLGLDPPRWSPLALLWDLFLPRKTGPFVPARSPRLVAPGGRKMEALQPIALPAAGFGMRMAAGIDLPPYRIHPVLGISELLALSVDPKSRLALVATRNGSLEHYSYPDFKLQETFHLEEPAYRRALDGETGLLYAAVSDPAALVVSAFGDRPSGHGHLHVYDVSTLLRGQKTPDPHLHPRAVIPFDGALTDLALSPDRQWLYYLAQRGENARAGRIHRQRLARESELILAGKVVKLCLTEDGKTLYAAGDRSLVVIDPDPLRVRQQVRVSGNLNDIAATNSGLVFLAEWGQLTDITVLHFEGERPPTEAGRWKADIHGRIYLQLAPDQRRLYIGSSSVLANSLYGVEVTTDQRVKPPGLGEVSSSREVVVRGQFFITPDGNYLVNHWGRVFQLIRPKVMGSN